jgi:hypothetical protein
MVDLGKGENKTKEFVDLNPNKTVPVLNDNGFVLYERSATPLNLVNLLFHFSLFTIAISDFAVKMLMSCTSFHYSAAILSYLARRFKVQHLIHLIHHLE